MNLFSLAETTRRSRRSGRRGNTPSARVIATAVAVAAGLIGGLTLSVSFATAEADRTGALQAQLDAVAPGGYLKLEPQVYHHAGVIDLRVPNVRIDGNGATLLATNDATSAVQVTAPGVQLTNLTLMAPTEGQRYSDLDQHKIVLSGDGQRVSGVSIVGSAAAGIFADGAQNFTIEDVSITGTRADGIHMTGGSRNGAVRNVRTDRTGDDAVAVVSYDSDSAPSGDIQVSGVSVAGTRWGRGVAVVGGRNVSVRGIFVANSSAAGIYIATEGSPYNTNSIESVTIADARISGANTDSGVVQGAVLVYSGNAGKSVRDVQISDVNITATASSAQRNVGVIVDGGSVSAVNLRNISIADSALPPFSSNAPANSYRASGWSVNGSPIASP
jgi:hypothetical protein